MKTKGINQLTETILSCPPCELHNDADLSDEHLITIFLRDLLNSTKSYTEGNITPVDDYTSMQYKLHSNSVQELLIDSYIKVVLIAGIRKSILKESKISPDFKLEIQLSSYNESVYSLIERTTILIMEPDKEKALSQILNLIKTLFHIVGGDFEKQLSWGVHLLTHK